MTAPTSLKRLIKYLQAKLPELESAAHRTMDREHEWWPFAFLRPEPEERFTSLRVVVLSCLYGTPAALFAVLASRVVVDVPLSLHLSTLIPTVYAAIFVLYRFTFAYCWNRRATHLRWLSERRASWRSGSGV